MNQTSKPVSLKTLFGHPKGVYVIVAAEMWERFSFYGMRALLVLFLVAPTTSHGFGWTNLQALQLFGIYSALLWTSPLVAGWIGDNFVGHKRAMIVGGVILVIGHLSLASPAFFPWLVQVITGVPVGSILIDSHISAGHFFLSPALKAALAESAMQTAIVMGSIRTEVFVNATYISYILSSYGFYFGLLCVICGSGFFKSNCAALIGRLYSDDDPRRDSGFTLYWVGVSMGSFLGPAIAGVLGEILGWHYGFSCAAVGMVAGLLIYLMFQQRTLGHLENLPSRRPTYKSGIAKNKSFDRSRMFVLLIFMFFVVLCIVGYELQAGMMNLYVDQSTDRRLFGIEWPTTSIQALVSLYIILFAPIAAILWIRLVEVGRNPSTPHKIVMALCFEALSVFLLYLATIEAQISPDGKSNLLWVIFALMVYAIGEVLYGPILLSAFSRLAPTNRQAMIIGFYYLSSAIGGLIAGQIGVLSEVIGVGIAFLATSVALLIAAGGMYLLRPFLIGRLSHL